MTRTAPSKRVAVAVVFASALASFSDLPLHAPFHGLVMAGGAVALIAVGYEGRSVYAVAAGWAALTGGVVLGLLSVTPSPGEHAAAESCDPGCIELSAMPLLAAPPAIVLACAGWATRAIVERRR